MPSSRISDHITHVGIVVSSVDPAMKFYRDALGFREISRGAGKNGEPGWIDLQTPDGSDYIELIPYSGNPSPTDAKAQNHLSLASSDVRKTVAILQSRLPKGSTNSSITVETGGGLPTRASFFDPDGAPSAICPNCYPSLPGPGNLIKRCLVEVRRRTRPMVRFVNVASVTAFVYSIFQRFNLEWKNRNLKLFTQAAQYRQLLFPLDNFLLSSYN